MTVPPEKIPAPADIDAAAANVTACDGRVSAIANRRQFINKRLQYELGAEIAHAIADGNADLAARLKSERAELETENRDLEPAERIAMDRANDAKRGHARVAAPKVFAELSESVAAYEALVSQLHQASVALAAQRLHAQRQFNTSGLEKSDPTNPGWVELSPMAMAVLSHLGSFTVRQG